MISQEKWEILSHLQNLPKNVGDLGKLIVAKGFKKLPKVQKIAKSGHTGCHNHCFLKMGRPRPLFHLFSSFQTNIKIFATN